MFNLFYKEIVSNLSAMECGIVIANSTFNAFCYADDLLLVSLTKTGLQKLINYANDYITSHGLRFNPNKTTCTIFGKNTLTPEPSWSLNNCNLKVTDSVTYLGVVLSSHMKSSAHVQDRIRKCQRAFYSVQSIGMCKNGSSCNVKSHIWKSIMLPILIYGCQCVNINTSSMHDLETAQSKLIQTAFGLPKFCRNTPLLHALCINKVRTQNITNQLNLINQIFCNNSKSRKLYDHLLNVELNGRKNIKNTLIDQIKYNLKDEDFNLSSYIMNNQYRRNLNKQLRL